MTVQPAVHLVHFYSTPGGIEVLSSRILPSFNDFLFRVFIIRPAAKGKINVYDEINVPVRYGSRNNLFALFRLYRYACDKRDDVFHLFNLGPFFTMAVKLAGVRNIVYSIHGTRYWKNKWQLAFRNPLWKLAVGRNVIITSNSEYSKKVFIENVVRGAEVQVVYNPISSSMFVPLPARPGSGYAPQPARDSSGDASQPETSNPSFTPQSASNSSGFARQSAGSSSWVLTIIYAGRLDRGKNLEKWIDVAVELHVRMSNTAFEIYGSGPLENTLSDRIGSSGAEGYIKLMGYRSDIGNVFRNAGLLLFLSEYESFGNVVVESILCGTPVIASDIPSMREIFRDYPIFLVTPGGDLCDQIAERLQAYEALVDAAISAGADFRERFSEEAYISSLGKIYNSFNG